jgi:predicted transcriptional regulator of viral defense system
MKISILASLDSLPYFTIEAIKQLLGEESVVAGTARTMLYRWVKAGHVYRLKKGVYMTRRFFERHRADADFASTISAILITQSYVSLEFILQRHGILTDVTYPVSAVTLKHTRVIESVLGTFVYRNIKESLFNGYTISDYLGVPFAQASVAKALFDFLYLRPLDERCSFPNYNLAEDLRLNLADISEIERTEFAGFVEASKSRKMEKIITNLRNSIWRP